MQQGLADQIAAEITQDGDGFMWFGTFSGLDRYDGYTFVHYRHDDADDHSLSGNVVTALYTTREGTVWVGSRGEGVNRLNARQQQFDRFQHDPASPHSLANDSPRMFFEDRRGVLWVATEGGLSRFDGESGTFTNYQHSDADPNSLASDAVRSIAEDASGMLWLGTANGLSRFDPRAGTFKTYRNDPGDDQSLGANGLWKVVVDHLGLIWIATDTGLDSLDPQSGHFTHYRHEAADPHSLGADPLDALMEDDAGRLWVGTFGGGISILDVERRSFTVYRHDPADPSSLSYDQVDKIFQDRSGLIWLGTGGGGVELYNPQQQAVTVYAPRMFDPNSIASPFVYSTLEDRDGIIWIGTRNAGLDRLDPTSGQVTHFPPQPGVPGRLGWPAIQDIKQDSTGALWVAAFGGGLYRRDPSTGIFTAFRHDPADPASLVHDNVRTLSFDENGMVWIATGGGLDRLNPATGTFTAYRARPNDPSALASDLLVGLEADQHGTVWIGTAGEGLQRLDVATNTFTRYSHNPRDPNSLAEDNVFAIHVDRAGAVWVGAQGGGLDRLDPATSSFTHYHQRDGLPSERIQSILEDGDPTSQTPGNLWIVTDRGVARLDAEPDDAAELRLGKRPTEHPVPFGLVDRRAGAALVGQSWRARRVRSDGHASGHPPAAGRPDGFARRQQARGPINPFRVGRVRQACQRLVHPASGRDRVRGAQLPRARPEPLPLQARWVRSRLDRRRRDTSGGHLYQPRRWRLRVPCDGGEPRRRLEHGRPIVGAHHHATLVGDTGVRALFVALIVGAFAAIYLSREIVLRDRRRRLEVLVGERTEALEAALATREAALSARDVFLRSIVHDLKGPLAGLSWQAQILSRRMRQVESDPLMVEAVDAIASGAADAAETIDELRDLTQLAAGEQLPLRLEQVDLVALCRQRLGARPDAQGGRFQLHTTEPDLIVQIDRARIGRVLDNLLDNAAKYSALEQPVDIEVSRATLHASEWAVVAVRDRGIGVPADELPHIFDQYFRAGNVGSVAGQGLGLASARQLARLHGGELEFESHEGHGSTFSMRLPLLPR